MALVKKAKTKKEESSSFDWQSTLSGLGASFFKNFADSLADKVRHRIEEMIDTLRRGAIGSLLIIIGAIFSLIGLAIFINEMLAMGDAVGYAVVGIFSVAVGLIIIKK